MGAIEQRNGRLAAEVKASATSEHRSDS